MRKSLRIGIRIAELCALFIALIPAGLRLKFGFFLLLLESRNGTPETSLRQLFLISDRIDWIINERALAYGAGEHPKIRLTSYHNFFSAEIEPYDTVLDVGCGRGTIAAAIAAHCKTVKVIGIDRNKEAIRNAREKYDLENLYFFEFDATEVDVLPVVKVVILSNVLEHMRERVRFLRQLIEKLKPKKILIRVPLFERSWVIPMRAELGMSYFSDDDHFIEHTLDQFSDEMRESGLSIIYLQTLWGEIWAKCEPIGK